MRRTSLAASLVLMLAVVARAEPRVQLGVDALRADGFKLLEGKRVGLVANPASVDAQLRPTVEVLRSAPNVRLVALFGPEHGIWGDEYAGDKIPDKSDPRTGLPVFSLYGKTRKPTPEMLDKVDVLVFDLQDIGCRSYTFASTMQVCMEACAAANKPLVILDRPNPLGGQRIEGGPVETGFESFVSLLDVPYVHGMTMGELAMMVRERVAPDYAGLTVVKMQGWTRDMVWADTGLEWVPTSPHVPHVSSVAGYAAVGQAGELQGVVSNGVGYTLPFQVVGTPTTDGEALAERMNKLWPGAKGLLFRPVRYKPFFGPYRGEVCGGVQVHVDPRTAPSLVEVNYRLLEAMDAPALLALATTRPANLFDKSTGGPEAKRLLADRGDLGPLFAQWRAYSDEFRQRRAKFLLY